MAEDLFEDFGSIVEPDGSLDINAILDGDPNLQKKKEDVEDSEDVQKTQKSSNDSVIDVNRALEQQDEDNVDTSNKKVEGEEEVKDKDKTPGQSKDTDVVDKTPSSNAPFTVIFARDLSDRGLLSSFDEEKLLKTIKEKGEPEALRFLIQEEVNTNVEAAKADFDEGYKTYLDLLGKGADQEQVGSLVQLKDFFKNVKDEGLDEDEGLRKDVLTRYYKATTQFSDSKIQKLIERSVDLGDDTEEAKEAVKTMNTLISNEFKRIEEEAEEDQRVAQEERVRQLTILKENIEGITEIIPGQKINKPTKDKMYNLITQPVQDKYGNTTNALWSKRSEDPMFFDSRVAYLLETGFFDKGKSWDKIKSVKTTEDIDSLEKYIEKRSNTGSSVGRGAQITEEEETKLRSIIEDTGSILK